MIAINLPKYYVYRHIRHDKNEPFYIGKATNQSNNSPYHRAYNKERNHIWKGIASKTTYDVEIILESNNHQTIIKKEAEFIKLYGKIIDKTGTLANIKDCDSILQSKAIQKSFRKSIKANLKNKKYKKFKIIPDFPKYIINNQGIIINLRNNKLVHKAYHSNKVQKVPIVWLSNDKEHRSKPIRLLVAQLFITNPLNLPEVININGDLENNCINNLKWVSYSDEKKHNINISGRKYKSKISITELKEIKYIYQHFPISQNKLAKLYNISQDYLGDLIKNKTKHVM